MGDMTKLEITDVAVKEAAKTCPAAYEILKKLFPDVFEEQCLMVERGSILKRPTERAGDHPDKCDYYIVGSRVNGGVLTGLDDGNRWSDSPFPEAWTGGNCPPSYKIKLLENRPNFEVSSWKEAIRELGLNKRG